MITLLVFFFGYLTILFSIIGYGYISSRILSVRFSLGEMGISGILFITILSYFTNFVFAHNLVHNSVFLVIGMLAFFLLLKKKLFRKKISLIFSIHLIHLGSRKNNDESILLNKDLNSIANKLVKAFKKNNFICLWRGIKCRKYNQIFSRKY